MSASTTYGIQYPPGLLDTLPVVPSTGSEGYATSSNDPLSASHQQPPVRLLPPQLFTSLHLQHLLSHPPDHVLFPFLHGLEGENDAQNTFFANASAGSHWVVGVEVPVAVRTASGEGAQQKPPQQQLSIDTGAGNGLKKKDVPENHQMQIQHHQLLRPKVPRYRGLVWVVCEEDVRKGGDKITLRILRRKVASSSPSSSEGDEDEMAGSSSAGGVAEKAGSSGAAMMGGGGMDVDIDGSSDFDFDLDDELSDSSSDAGDISSGTSSFDADEDDDDDEDEEDEELYADDEREVELSNPAINLNTGSDTLVEDEEGSIQPPLPSLDPTKVKTKDELSKEEMDSMPYMHPVISPHRGPAQHPQLASINTSLPLPAPPHPNSHSHPHSVTSSSHAADPGARSGNSSAASSLDSSVSGSVSGVESRSLGSGIGRDGSLGEGMSTAPTSVASTSPVSASPVGTLEDGKVEGYPRVIKLEEAPNHSVKGSGQQKEEEGKKSKTKNSDGTATPRKKTEKSGKERKSKSTTPKNQSRNKKDKRKKRTPTDPKAPPLLTCTFRPKELLRRKRVPGAVPPSSSEVWEFVPARVPDGISLRNFGIQMPIYATISDIVIYSPKGVTPACVALAERFREAIDRKRRERVNAVKGVVYSQVHGHGHGQHHYRGGSHSNNANNADGAGGSGGHGSGHFIKIEDVLKAERENRARAKVAKTAANAAKGTPTTTTTTTSDAPQVVGEESTTTTPPGSASLPPSASSPTPSDSASEDDSIFDSSSDDDEDDLETRMLDTAERYLMSLVEDDLLDYNVFILDADEEKMRSREGGMGHLMVRLCGAGVPGGSSSSVVGTPSPSSGDVDVGGAASGKKSSGKKSGSGSRKKKSSKSSNGTTMTGAHTVGTDGEVRPDAMNVDHHHHHHHHHRQPHQRDEDEGMVVGDMDIDTEPISNTVDVEMEEISSPPSRRPHTRPPQHSRTEENYSGVQEDSEEDSEDEYENTLIPNTVDFALREKEEMRDLTKASEIISLFPRPTPATSPLSASPSTALSPTSSSIASPAPGHPQGFASQQQPAHLQHLRNLIPPMSSSGRYPHQQQPYPFQPQAPQQQQVQVEYAFTHPDPGVDISNPATFFDPRVGQVFLGNSGDVPLVQNAVAVAANGLKKSGGKSRGAGGDSLVVRNGERGERHVRDVGVDPLVLGGEGGNGEKSLDVPHVEFAPIVDGMSTEEEDEEDEDLPPDDPFNYFATNDPKNGFGYDICLECHELAPFPTGTHLRAAEEHLGVLEGMWRERYVAKEKARREKAKGKAKTRKHTGVQSSDLNEDESLQDEGFDEDVTPIIVPPRPPPHANAVIHLPFPSSPPNTQQTMAQLLPILRFLEKWIRPVPGEVRIEVEVKEEKPKEDPTTPTPAGTTSGVRRWSSSVASLMPSVFNIGNTSSTNNVSPPPSSSSSRSRSFTTPAPTSHHRNNSGSSSASSSPPHPTRPLKILLYSADGYTESSLAALCLLMSVKGLTLPEAYLDLQVGKRRSFFVYQHDLAVVRRVETRLIDDRERERERERVMRERMEMERMVREAREREREARERMVREREQQQQQHQKSRSSGDEQEELNANGKRTIGSVHNMSGSEGKSGGLSLFKVFGGSVVQSPSSSSAASPSSGPTRPPSAGAKPFTGRPAAKSVSFSQAPTWAGQRAGPSSSPSQQTRIPPTIPQGVVDSSAGGHVALRPPEEFTGSLPQKSATLPTIPSSGVLPTVSTVSGGLGHQNGAGGVGRGSHTGTKRPRANTSPWLPSFFGGDHQSWFNDPRFDGSFPSRVLPFLYLGNLNHASNVYMLHALGITHVVSVGECALLPPPYHMVGHSPGPNPSSAACAPRHMNAHAAKTGHGSLWIEEREGRIKVLDIKGVCDDGIDTLEPQLEPICEWIDKAREEGGQVLVHCRVGVSRSATVTIAYVMKHLSLPLVDAYLIVRSRRLSVLIQPNMRLLYNLCGWEVKLARERAGWVEDDSVDDHSISALRSLKDYMGGERKAQKRREMEKKLERELARTLTWPYLAMEVHKLNEKYLH